MPNWCDNTININGDIEKMKPIVEKLKQCERDLKTNPNNPMRVMETLLGTDDRPSDYEQGGWYSYNVAIFGTKWDFSLDDCTHYELDDGILIQVMTAWSPPEAFLEKLCEIYGVNGSIQYAEPGCDFAGSAEFGPTGVETSTTSTYLKGLYDNDMDFWGEVENNAYNCDTKEEFTKGLSFLNNKEMEEAIEIFNEMKEQEED